MEARGSGLRGLVAVNYDPWWYWIFRSPKWTCTFWVHNLILSQHYAINDYHRIKTRWANKFGNPIEFRWNPFTLIEPQLHTFFLTETLENASLIFSDIRSLILVNKYLVIKYQVNMWRVLADRVDHGQIDLSKVWCMFGIVSTSLRFCPQIIEKLINALWICARLFAHLRPYATLTWVTFL